MFDVALSILHSAASNLAVDSAPGKQHGYPQPGGAQDLGVPQGSHENSSNFKPVSRASKVMKIGPKATPKHQKLTLETTEFQLL